MLSAVVDNVAAGYQRVSEAASRAYYHPWNRELTLEKTFGLLGRFSAGLVKKYPKSATTLVDTLSLSAAGFGIGTIFETGINHLTPDAWMSSRLTSLAIGFVTNAPYGRWDDFLRRKMSNQYLASLTALNTFWAPIYAGILATSTWYGEGAVDTSKIAIGVAGLVIASPISSFALSWSKDKAREYCGISTVTEKPSPEYQSCTERLPAPVFLKE